MTSHNAEAVAKTRSADQTTANTFFGQKGGVYSIPLVGPVLRAANAILETASFVFAMGAGSALGKAALTAVALQKPVNMEAATQIAPSLAPDMTTGDGVDYSTPLSYRRGNKVALLPMGVQADEMAMDYIKSMPALVAQGLFSASSPPIVIPVTPMYTSAYTPDNNLWQPTFVGFLGWRFQWWRGSMCYMFHIVANSFMTGLLRIRWVPGADPSTFDPATMNFPNDLYTIFVDIQTETTVKFCVPWLTTGS